MNMRRADILLLLIVERYLEIEKPSELSPELTLEITEALQAKRRQLRETRPPLDRFFMSPCQSRHREQ